jgi:hypothetical protein
LSCTRFRTRDLRHCWYHADDRASAEAAAGAEHRSGPRALRGWIILVRGDRNAPAAWREIYHEVERCAGKVGDYDRIRWAVMAAPLMGPRGPTFGFTVGERIVLVSNDTTYLRHEMLHHILQTAGWQPRELQAREHYTIADLHPMPLFGLCTGGR